MRTSRAFRRVSRPLPWVVVILLAAVPAGLLRAQGTTREEFTAFAVSTGGPRTNAVASQISFSIERWSSGAQREALAQAFREKGAEGLLSALRDLPEVGYMRTPGALGYPLRYADQQALPDGGRRIVLATDRPIAFSETWRSSRTLDYPFTVIELGLDRDGTGEGKMSWATKVVSIGGRISLENWASAPVQLNNVKPAR